MKINKKKCFSLLAFLMFVCNINAQQKTNYEKKILEIEKKYVKKILIGQGKWSQRSEAELFYANKEYLEAVLAIGLMATPQYIKSFSNEIKQAEKLKTGIDFQKEKDEKLKKENKENERNQQVKVELLERSDIGIIKKNIKDVFGKWNQKGEFEKQTDYDVRLQNQSQNIFIQTCIDEIKRKINNYSGYSLNKELLPYNAESEFFDIKFKFNNVTWINKINIPIANAEAFKNNWQNFDSDISAFDWCFIENALCPTVVTLSNKNSTYQISSPVQNQKQISYFFDELGIDNLYLKNYIFNYSDAKKIEEQAIKERFEKKSLKIKLYNEKLESEFQNLNSQLIKNEYNIDKNIITKYDKISDIIPEKSDYYNEDEESAKNSSITDKDEIIIEKNYIEKLRQITENFATITTQVETDFSITYRDVDELFENKEEFLKYYLQGRDKVKVETETRKEKKELEKIFNYLNINLIYLEAMDFKRNDPMKNFTDGNRTRMKILSLLTECNKKSYYNKILDFVFEKNKDLNKRWSKDGEFFKDKMGLYEAYTIGDYKQILKSKKSN